MVSFSVCVLCVCILIYALVCAYVYVFVHMFLCGCIGMHVYMCWWTLFLSKFSFLPWDSK